LAKENGSMQWQCWIVGLIISLVVWVGVRGIGAAPPSPGGTLTIAVPDEPPGLDPTTSPAAASARIVYNNLLEGLVKLNMQGEIVRALAERYVVSTDGQEYTFTLRRGVKFHNGRLLTADDVKFYAGTQP
jgi:peptide/nickel transport system substrate-binding protein